MRKPSHFSDSDSDSDSEGEKLREKVSPDNILKADTSTNKVNYKVNSKLCVT